MAQLRQRDLVKVVSDEVEEMGIRLKIYFNG
jgi:hypothetical protein